jgi:phosphomannomutase
MDCFRTCDIRGRYPEEIDENLFFHLGRNIALKHLAGREILIGSDLRVSSPALKDALAKGLEQGGAKVLDAGQVPTPVVYFGKRQLGTFAAAVVTASHNPPHDNGLKLMLGRYPATAAQLRALRPGPANTRSAHSMGQIESVDLRPAYVDFVVGTWKGRLKGDGAAGDFVLDPGNGTWTLLIAEIIRRLEISAKVIHAEPDGRFPSRSPDCAAPGSLSALGAEVRRCSASAGLAWDGDGDRLAVCDDAGRPVMTDHLVLLLLPGILENHRQEKILFDGKMSRRVKSAIEGNGGIPVEEKSAHCCLEARMINDECLFGCEYSGHYFYRGLGGGDDGMYAALSLVEFLGRHPRPLTSLLESTPKMFISPDLRISGEGLDFDGVRHSLRAGFSDATISEFDGLRIETSGAWLLVRPSVSENKVSFRFEGDSRGNLDSIIRRVLELLPQCGSLLSSQMAEWQKAFIS